MTRNVPKSENMNKLLLRFQIDLKNADAKSGFDFVNGPLFHEWLPDGEKDAIEIAMHENVSLQVWFERRGFTDSMGFFHFDYNKKNYDPSVFDRQALLDAGPLFGLLTYGVLTAKQQEVLINKKTGDEEYVSFARLILNDILYLKISKFVETLRLHYGQYWLPVIKKWDSRDMSLSTYARNIFDLQWSLDEGKTWHPLVPDEHKSVWRITSTLTTDYSDFISKDDWAEISTLTNQNISLAQSLLIQTHEYLDKGNTKLAFISGVAALEVAIEQVLEERKKDWSDALKKTVSFFDVDQLGVTKSFSLIALLLPLEKAHIEQTVSAIDKRNAIAHGAHEPKVEDKKNLKVLMWIVKQILNLRVQKLPSLKTGNSLAGKNRNISKSAGLI